MFQVFSGATIYLLPGGRTLKLVKDGKTIINSTNPFARMGLLTKNITFIMLVCSGLLQVSLIFSCVGV